MNPISGLSRQETAPILVSGTHRSGTTWVGKMLAAGPEVAYISEPMNVWHRPGVMRIPTQYWYTYICEENQGEYLTAFQEMLHFNYHTGMEIRSIKSIKDLLRMLRDWSIFLNGRKHHQIPLIKDPFALFSSEWFSRTFGCRVIITVRHPAAVASSLKKLGWRFDFGDLLHQSLLMRDFLEPYRNEIESILAAPGDLVAESCLLWRMVYRSVQELKNKIPGLIVIRHEDIAFEPLAAYNGLYNDLGLDFSNEVQQAIQSSSSRENPKETSSENIHSVRIDSQAVVESWKERLTKTEVDRIRQLTRDVAPNYYTDEDWH